MRLVVRAQGRVAERDMANFFPPVGIRCLLYRPIAAVSRLAALALRLWVGEGCRLPRTPPSATDHKAFKCPLARPLTLLS